MRYELRIKSTKGISQVGRNGAVGHSFAKANIGCYLSNVRGNTIFLSNRSRDLPRAAVVCGGGKKRNGRNKNITFRDGAPKSAPETSGPFLVFHWRYSARQIECLFSEK